MTDSDESQLLLACARTQMDASSRLRIDELLKHSLHWNQLLEMARQHRLRPLLFAGLSLAPKASVPPDVLERLSGFASGNSRRALFLTGELFRILDLFRKHGIAAAAFKGPTLALLAYGNVALREAGDLDILVRRSDIVRARRLLLDEHFQPVYPTADEAEVKYLRGLSGQRETDYLLSHCEHHLIGPKGEVNVDLHWSLALRQFALPLTQLELKRWISPQTVGGRMLLTFAPEEMLLVLCINGAKDCWQRLDRICDVAELLRANPDLSWPYVHRLAAGIGGQRMLYLGLKLAEELLGAQLPALAKEWISADRYLPAMTNRVRRNLFRRQADEVEAAGLAKSIFHLLIRQRLVDRVRYILAQFEPTVGDWAALPLPHGVSFLHYFTRPIRLLWRYGRRSFGGAAHD